VLSGLSQTLKRGIVEEIRMKLERLGYRRLFPEQQIPPDEQRVLELEAEIGLRLPEEYRAFLLEWGSIAPSVPVEVPMPNRLDDNCAVCYFLGFYRPDPNPNLLRFDLNHVYGVTRHRIGASVLPIATGEGGALVCLFLSPNHQRGAIWAWASELDDEEEWKLYSLADSLTDLIQNLRPFTDPRG
jgi:hypothetical protein